MRIKKSNFFVKILIIISILILLLSNTVSVYAEEIKYYLGGQIAGFVLDEEGATVIAFTDIVTDNGIFSPAESAGIKKGDVILSLDGKKIQTAQDVDKMLSLYTQGEMVVEISRNGNKILKDVTPSVDINGKAKLGIIIRDAMSGIGTVTYYTSEGEFSALGHPIYNDNNDIFNVSCGKIYPSTVIGVYKGKRGVPGEIKGIFSETNQIGEIISNGKCGIKGKINSLENKVEIELGKGEIGKAEIFCCIEGNKVSKYGVSIVKYDQYNKHNKNFVIKITDETLLDKTGGIVQGMSGSPIVQNGKLIGAITHVFVNDPTRGYGISVNNLVCNN